MEINFFYMLGKLDRGWDVELVFYIWPYMRYEVSYS